MSYAPGSYFYNSAYNHYPLSQDIDDWDTRPPFDSLTDTAPGTSFETVVWSGADIIIRQTPIVSGASGFRTIDDLRVLTPVSFEWFRNLSTHRRTIRISDNVVYTFYFASTRNVYTSGDVVEGYSLPNNIIGRILPGVNWHGDIWGVKHQYDTGIPMPIILDEARQSLFTFARAFVQGHDHLFVPVSPPQRGSYIPGIYMPLSTRAIGPAGIERSESSSALQVYSAPELMDGIINELDTMSLLTLRRTSGRLRYLVNRALYSRLCILLGSFVPYGHLEEFKRTLNHTESIIAGVFIVAILNWDRSWDLFQLDLLIPPTARAAWNEFFMEAGFIREHVADRFDSYGNLRLVTMTWKYCGNYGSIRLVESADGMALTPLFTSRTTMTLNFMTLSTIYSLYPRQTFQCQALISRANHSSSVSLLTNFVTQFRFTAVLDSAGPGLHCGMGCLRRVRTLRGFRGVAVIDIFEKDHDISQRPQKPIDEGKLTYTWCLGPKCLNCLWRSRHGESVCP